MRALLIIFCLVVLFCCLSNIVFGLLASKSSLGSGSHRSSRSYRLALAFEFLLLFVPRSRCRCPVLCSFVCVSVFFCFSVRCWFSWGSLRRDPIEVEGRQFLLFGGPKQTGDVVALLSSVPRYLYSFFVVLKNILLALLVRESAAASSLVVARLRHDILGMLSRHTDRPALQQGLCLCLICSIYASHRQLGHCFRLSPRGPQRHVSIRDNEFQVVAFSI